MLKQKQQRKRNKQKETTTAGETSCWIIKHEITNWFLGRLFDFSLFCLFVVVVFFPPVFSLFIQAHSHAPVFCFSMVLLLLLSTIKPNVSSSCFDRFQWNLVTMINDPARICHMTLDRVKGHPRSQGSKRSFLPKTHQVLRIMQHGPVTHVCSSPWPTLQMLLDHFFIRGHLGSQGSNIKSES